MTKGFEKFLKCDRNMPAPVDVAFQELVGVGQHVILNIFHVKVDVRDFDDRVVSL